MPSSAPYRNFELNQMDIDRTAGPRLLCGGIWHSLLMMSSMLVAHHDYVTEPKIKKIHVDALEAGVQFLVNHPEEGWKLFIRGRKDLDNKLNRLAWRDTLPRFALRPGALDHTRYERFAKFLKTQSLIKKIPQIERYAVELN